MIWAAASLASRDRHSGRKRKAIAIYPAEAAIQTSSSALPPSSRVDGDLTLRECVVHISRASHPDVRTVEHVSLPTRPASSSCCQTQASVDLRLQAEPARRGKTVAMNFSFLRWNRSSIDTLRRENVQPDSSISMEIVQRDGYL